MGYSLQKGQGLGPDIWAPQWQAVASGSPRNTVALSPVARGTKGQKAVPREPPRQERRWEMG